MDCNENTLLELLENRASSKSEAKRIFNLIRNTDLEVWTIGDLTALKGIGRKSLHVIMDVACDLQGKK